MRTKKKETVYVPLMVIGHVISNADAESNENEEERKCRRTRDETAEDCADDMKRSRFRRHEYRVASQYAKEDSRCWRQWLDFLKQHVIVIENSPFIEDRKLLRATCT